MLFYENVYTVCKEYNQRFETLIVPVNTKPGLIQRLLVALQSVTAQRLSKPSQVPVQAARNTIV